MTALTREQMCGLLGVDIAGFTLADRDDDVRAYLRKALYEMLQAGFDRSGVPWSGCVHEDRGDGALVVIPAAIGAAELVDPFLALLRGSIRRHNRMSCHAARMQLRVATHIGLVDHDGHGFVGEAANLLFRLLEAAQLKRDLAASGAELAYITSGYVYENVIRRHPALVDPGAFQPVRVRVKETRADAWIYLPGVQGGSTWG